MDYLTTHTNLSPIWRGFAPGFGNYKKGCTRLAAASDKVYQLLAHSQWLSPGTPASSTTKTGCHDIAEILLKVALNTINHQHIHNLSVNQSKLYFPPIHWLLKWRLLTNQHSTKDFPQECQIILLIPFVVSYFPLNLIWFRFFLLQIQELISNWLNK